MFGRMVSEPCAKKIRACSWVGSASGATLAGVLGCVGAGAEVIVVEKLTTVVTLLRGELAHLGNGELDDPRVTLLNVKTSRKCFCASA